MLKLCRNVLHGKTAMVPTDASDKLIDYLKGHFGLRLEQLRIRQGTDPHTQAKANNVITVLRVMLKLCVDKEVVDTLSIKDPVLKIRFMAPADESRAVGTGERFIYDTVSFDFGKMIVRAQSKREIVQYQGPSWLNERERALKRILGNTDLHVRVGIVSPESASFESFAAWVGMMPQCVRHLIDIELATWERFHAGGQLWRRHPILQGESRGHPTPRHTRQGIHPAERPDNHPGDPGHAGHFRAAWL